MKIFVISLTKSVHRREKILHLMDELALSFEFFDAVDGSLEHPLIKERYNDKKRVAVKGYSAKLGELGCFASHYLLWQKCLELDVPLVILEDDIILKKEFASFIKQIEENPLSPELEVIRLADSISPYLKLRNITNNQTLIKYIKCPRGTQGYLMYPSAAKKLLSYSKEWYEPVDDFMDKEWLHRVTSYGVEPCCLLHDLSIPSDIGDRRKPLVPLSQRIKREYYRTRDWLMHQLFLLPWRARIRR